MNDAANRAAAAAGIDESADAASDRDALIARIEATRSSLSETIEALADKPAILDSVRTRAMLAIVAAIAIAAVFVFRRRRPKPGEAIEVDDLTLIDPLDLEPPT